MKDTITQLFKVDDVKQILEQLNEQKDNIESMLVIYSTNKGELVLANTPMDNLQVIGYLEVAKSQHLDSIMYQEEEDEI